MGVRFQNPALYLVLAALFLWFLMGLLSWKVNTLADLYNMFHYIYAHKRAGYDDPLHVHTFYYSL
jgi:hypothetical protein